MSPVSGSSFSTEFRNPGGKLPGFLLGFLCSLRHQARLMGDLAAAIREKTDSDVGLNKRLVLFGHTDCDAAATEIAEFVENHLKSRIVEQLLVAVASGGTFGFRLSDGRSIFLKIHAGEHPPERLQAIHDAQETLRQRGIPVARRVRSLTAFGRNGRLASVHAFRDRGEKLRAGHRGAVEAAARGLARLNQAAAEIAPATMRWIFDSNPNPIYMRASEAAPVAPQRAASDRADTLLAQVGEKTREIKANMIVSHGDWAARNLRFWNGDVSSIFDLEALVSGPHAYLVGRAALLFVNEPRGVANPADAVARFIETYEAAGGQNFQGEDLGFIDAGVAHGVARYLVGTIRSGHVKDEEAEDIFRIFMGKFRTRFARNYTPVV